MVRPGLALLALLVGYVHNQLARFLPNYLSAVAVPLCQGAGDPCDTPHGAHPVDLCDACPLNGTAGYWPDCEPCHRCLEEHHAARVNLLDGACVSSAEYGLLSGYAFSAVFSLGVLAAGRVADTSVRSRVAVVAVVVWSAAIALHGIAGSFPELVGARALLGLAQSFYTPPSYSLLASMFPPAQRARANSVFALGVYLGCSLASLVLLVAPTLGWRAVCFTIGASGLPIAALLCGVVREPGLSSARPASTEGTPLRDGAADSATLLQGQPPAAAVDDAAAPHKPRARAVRDAGSAVCAVLACPRVVLVTLASTFRFAGGIAVASFLPIAFRRAFPDQNAAFGVGNALIIAFAGSASSLAGGAITTVWAQRWAPAESAVPAASALLALGPFYVAAHSEHFAPAMVSLAAFFLVGEGWLGSALAAVQRHAPAQHRGLATSLLLFLASAVGNASPAVLGRLDDGTPRLRVLLFWTVTATYMAAAALFLAAAALPPPSERPGLRRRPTPSTSSEAAPMLGNPQDAPLRVVVPPQPRPPVGQELRGP